MGSLTYLPRDYAKCLNARGIKTHAFNPLRPQLAMAMNNRDHRKILVIDGKVAFTGGCNISDEYINTKKRFGHWKDMGCMIKGAGVEMFTIPSYRSGTIKPVNIHRIRVLFKIVKSFHH